MGDTLNTTASIDGAAFEDAGTFAAAGEGEPRGMRRVYSTAGLARLVAGIDAYLSDEFTRGVKSSIETVVNAEAPIEKGLLFNEVCSSYGADAGAIDILRKNEGLLKGIPHKETRYGGSVFVWRADQDPERYFEYRVAPQGVEGRFIGRVAFEELSALLYDVVLRESPLDVDLMIDIALDESGYTGPRTKSRRVLLDVFKAMCSAGLLAADENDDVSIVRDLADISANGTGSAATSPVTVVTGEIRRASVALDARPADDRGFDAHAAGIRRMTGEAGGDHVARDRSEGGPSDKKRAARPAGEKRARKSSPVKTSGGHGGKVNLGEEQGVISNAGGVKLYVPDAPTGGDLLAQRYMDPAAVSRLIGGTVQHQKFGAGKIKKIEGNRVIIAFGGEMKQFVYPTIFMNGIVVIVDREV